MTQKIIFCRMVRYGYTVWLYNTMWMNYILSFAVTSCSCIFLCCIMIQSSLTLESLV